MVGANRLQQRVSVRFTDAEAAKLDEALSITEEHRSSFVRRAVNQLVEKTVDQNNHK